MLIITFIRFCFSA